MYPVSLPQFTDIVLALAEAQHQHSPILGTPHLFIALIGLRSIKYTPETRRKLNVSCS